jgi:AcrR family transcriptional regulator
LENQLRSPVADTRSYTSPLRDSDAAQTRARIVDAAARLFIRDGYAATPLRAIAIEAEVSVQSVHLAGPKSALLLAAFERTFAGDEGRHPLSERLELQAIIAEPNNGNALTMYIDFLASANERSAPIWRALEAAADADPAARDAAEDLEARRLAEMQTAAQFFLSRGLLEPDAIADAADQFGFLTQPNTFLYLVSGRGWSIDRYKRWLRSALEKLVLTGL